MAAGDILDCDTCAKTHGCPMEGYLGNCDGSDGMKDNSHNDSNDDSNDDDYDIENDPILNRY